MKKYREINKCRISQSPDLVTVLSLGHQALTGVFPKSQDEQITTGPLDLVWCPESGLLQLGHSFESGEMYGENYGYRSGLNQSMVEHLSRKVAWLEKRIGLQNGDTVLDIGSNDCTTLKAYSSSHIKRIGIDPTGTKFKAYYPDDVKLVPDFFNPANFNSVSNKKAKIVTSIAMFYDLEDPISFARDVASILHKDGLWHFEQSYMPSMLRLTSYDTICHEHLEYYSLKVVKYIVEQAGLKLIDVSMNAVNGGSFALSVAHHDNHNFKPNTPVIDWLLAQEDAMGLYTPRPYRDFEERVYRHRQDLINLIRTLVADGKKVLGYGASTKGNAVLQFCNFTTADIPAIAEINEEKFGRFTPGTHIPIISEAKAHALKPDYFLVLPWHFKEGILKREKEFFNSGGHFIFPFPEVEII